MGLIDVLRRFRVVDAHAHNWNLFADTAYMRLRELLPEKEMNTFAQMYYLEQRKRMANSKEWL